MKSSRLLSVLLIFMLALLAILCSCGDKTDTLGNGKDNELSVETGEDGRQVLHAINIVNIADYTIVRPDNSSQNVTNLCVAFREKINEYLNAKIPISTDFKKNSFEILIGNTARDESKSAAEGLAYHDYCIKLSGYKIVIVGGSEAALETALNEFTENFMYDGIVVVPNGDGLIYHRAYKFDSLKIDGIDIADFKIYATNPECARRLSENILESYLGETIKITTDKDEAGHKIILDASSMDYTPFRAEYKDENLYVTGSFKSCINFLDYYVAKNEKDVNVKGTISGEIAKPVLYDKAQLMSVLSIVYGENKIILGQQTNGGLTMPSDAFDRYKKATGAMPSIIGIDLACYGLQLPTATPEEWSEAFCELVEYAEGGGIVTISSHFANPTGNSGDDKTPRSCRGTIGFEDAWEQLLTEGTEYNTFFTDELATDAKFLKAFDDIGLSVIFRPLHEINSNWFWFSISQNGKILDASYGTRLWQYIYDYMIKTNGIDSMVWEYAPNNQNGWIDVLYCYPGDEYCDIVGVDWYTNGEYEIDGTGASYNKMMGTEKICNITEFGIGGDIESKDKDEQVTLFSCTDFIGIIDRMFSDGYKIGYVLTWTGQDSPEWWGKCNEMMNTGYVLTQEDLLGYFNTVRTSK